MSLMDISTYPEQAKHTAKYITPTLLSISPALAKRMENATIRQDCGPTINGNRHLYLSANKAMTSEDIAPHMYGGIVISCEVADEYPILILVSGRTDNTIPKGQAHCFEDRRHCEFQGIIGRGVGPINERQQVDLEITDDLFEEATVEMLAVVPELPRVTGTSNNLSKLQITDLVCIQPAG